MYGETPLFKAVTYNLPQGMSVDEAIASIANNLHFNRYSVVSFSVYPDPSKPDALKITVLGKIKP